MRAYSIFDDYPEEAVRILASAGVQADLHPHGIPRPDHDRMKELLEIYDCVIIGTSQKITEDMFENVTEPRIIATASIGLDHIRIPEEKRQLVTVLNTPTANVLSVAEYTLGCALQCVKRMEEGRRLYLSEKDNKAMHAKPEDLSGKRAGVIGAGNISVRIMEYFRMLGMQVICWTKHPDAHKELKNAGVRFVSLPELAETADVISVNLPNREETMGLVTKELIKKMKDTCIFISVSRKETADPEALFEKAKESPGFYVCLDLDVDADIVRMIPDLPNVSVTPHIAGGTREARIRMFTDLAEQIAKRNRM